MKLNNIIKGMSFAAVALIATACSDTDAQYTIPEVGAPEFVSATPESDAELLFGEHTFTVTFDKNIGFATKNASQITLNGVPVKSALVLGASPSLTITADVDFSKTQTLVIPAGLIIGPQGDAYDQEIKLTWTLEDLPSNTAVAMTQKLGWGWNLGNHFDTSGDAISQGWGYWDRATPGAELFNSLAKAGAKTVRIPTTWTDHMNDNSVISADYLNEVAGVVDAAIAAGLNVILNTHHDSFETDLGNAANPEKKDVAKADSALISTLWTQVANKFKNYGEQLIFETFNEVHAGDNWGGGSAEEYDMLNKWNQYAVDAIRATGGNNATRWIGVSGYAANLDLTLNNLVLPTDPANRIMVAVHCYDPYGFCLAPVGADGTETYSSWGHNADPAFSVPDANEEYVIKLLFKLRKKYIEQGIPCYLGEYGCVVHTTDNANAFRKYYLEFFCRAAYMAGLPMLVWDNNSVSCGTSSGNECSSFFDHSTGAYVADGAEVVPMMIKACTSTDSSYWFDTIWSKSPTVK